MILLDTSGLLAAIDSSQEDHAAARSALEAAPRPWILSPFVLAELDYLLARRVGQNAELALLDEVARTVYRLAEFDYQDIRAARDLIAQYASLDLGLADASIVVLANRYDCVDILTLDQRHFRAILGPGQRPFRLLPSDVE